MASLALRRRADSLFTKAFTGEGMDYRRVLAIFLPVLVDQAFVSCMNLFNTAMVSTSGMAAVSAVNMVDSLNFLLVSIFIAISTGGTVIVAQYKGNGDDKMVPKAAGGSISATFLFAFAVSALVLIFHREALLVLFGTAPPDVMKNAQIYLLGSGASYCGIAVEEGVCGAMRGVGHTRSSLLLSVEMNASYMLLNLLFINALHMGVVGLAISVNIARYGAAAVSLFFILKIDTHVRAKLRDIIRIRFSMVKKVLTVGLPFAMEQIFFNSGKILTQTFIVQLGTYALATNAICMSMSAIYQIPANALSLTAITVVGQSMGRRNLVDARKFTRSFLFAASAFYILAGALLLPLFKPMVSLFSPPPQIVPTILLILCIHLGMSVLLWPNSFLRAACLRAAGDSKFTSVASMLSMWFFRVVMGYVLAITLHIGIFGVWLAMDMEWGVRGVIFFVRYRGRKWYEHHLID